MWNLRITEVYGKIYADFTGPECQSIVRFHAPDHKIWVNISFYWIIRSNVSKDEKNSISWNTNSTSLFWYGKYQDKEHIFIRLLMKMNTENHSQSKCCCIVKSEGPVLATETVLCFKAVIITSSWCPLDRWKKASLLIVRDFCCTLRNGQMVLWQLLPLLCWTSVLSNASRKLTVCVGGKGWAEEY